MLTYNIRLTNALPDRSRVILQSYSINDLIENVIFIDENNYDEVLSNQQLLVCRYDEDPNLKEGDDVVIRGSIDIDDDTNIERTSLERYEYITTKVAGVNTVDKTFTLFIEKYRLLTVESMEMVGMYGPDENERYHCKLRFMFDGNHYFRRSDDNIVITASFDDGTNVDIKCTYIDNSTLETMDFYEINDTATNLYNKLYYAGRLRYETIIYRTNPWFTESGNFDIYSTNILSNVIVPISGIFTPDMNKDGLLNDYYVGDEMQAAINRANDMEKDVYHPVYIKKNDNEDEEINYLQNLRFNIHLRQREGKDWSILSDPDNKEYTLWNYYKCGNTDSDNDNSNVSDLLSFLDFTNNDVRYRKKKLGKTFLRLSFYDSPDERSQNLLHTSTIFVNVNELYAKYNRYGYDSEENFITMPKRSSYTIDNGKLVFNTTPTDESVLRNRIKVDTENIVDGLISEDESKRLSSQFSVFDRNISTNSSEGFYFYLWKDNYYGTEPIDIYLKIDLNHAKYGRVIPLMVPFTGPIRSEDETHSLMKLSDMINQWTDDSDTIDMTIDGTGFTNYEYQDYRYIRLRYKYDSNLRKHIYYLNNDFYDNLNNLWGDNTGVYNDDDNSVTINLFEANMK